jgi:hypothetical protein
VNNRKQELQLRATLSDPDAHEILAQAINDVPGFVTPPEIPIPERRLLIGIASLATGDSSFTRRLLHYLKGEEHTLLAARHFLWTGDDATFRGELAKILPALHTSESFAELSDVGNALESIGAVTEANFCRERANSAQRRLLTDWEGSNCDMLPAANAADTTLAFVHGMLGAQPDAPRGRLRLRICLPEWIDYMVVHNLRLGDAMLSLRYAREATNIRYQIEQFAGAMPVRLIFEPTFTQRIQSVDVDGVSASLSLQQQEDRIVAPMQLMLDDARLVSFELG